MQDIIVIDEVWTGYGNRKIHHGLNLRVKSGRITALIGGSGSGKSTLFKSIIGLLKPLSGNITLFGIDVWRSLDSFASVRNRFGVLFQNGALFSGLSVVDNIKAPMREQASMPECLMDDLVNLKLRSVGLETSVGQLMPAELSGGMRKRVALARALAIDPELVFLDEPTSGLDPINARAFDGLVRMLCDSLGLTVFMITHDLDTIESIVDTVVVLGGGRVIAEGSPEEVKLIQDPWLQSYFSRRAGEDGN